MSAHERESPWYETAFGTDYLDRYAHRGDEEAELAVRHIVAPLPVDRGLPILDLCCGAGRHALPLARLGRRVVGFDLSAPLLAEAVRTHARQGCAFRPVRGTMRLLPFRQGSFGVVANFFTAFGYFAEDTENEAVLTEIESVLCPGGWMILDFLNRPRVLARFTGGTRFVDEQELGDGGRIVTERSLTPDGRRAEKETRWLTSGQVTRVVRESVRLYSPAELRAALTRAGLALEQEVGDYAGAPFRESDSDRWIALARKPVR